MVFYVLLAYNNEFRSMLIGQDFEKPIEDIYSNPFKMTMVLQSRLYQHFNFQGWNVLNFVFRSKSILCIAWSWYSKQLHLSLLRYDNA